MLLTITLNTAEDGRDAAEDAIKIIAGMFDVSLSSFDCGPALALPTPVFITSNDNINPASIGFGGATTPPGVVVDSAGLPHDTRIHASPAAGKPPTKNADGTWKKKKNVDEAERTRVEAELRSVMSVVAPAPVAFQVPAPPVVEAIAPPPPAAPAPPAVVPPPPVVEAIAPPPPAAPAPPAVNPAPTSFATLMGWLGPHMTAQRISSAQTAEAMKALGLVDAHGIGQLTLLAARPDLVESAYALLQQQVGA